MSESRGVTYEITAEVPAELAERFEHYMIETHIPDLIATGHFRSAIFCRSDNMYRIRYELDSERALDEYLKTDAPRLREDFSQHFPTGIDVSRQTWHHIASFSA